MATCFLCGIGSGVKECDKCCLVHYCSQHEYLHSDSAGECLGFRIERSPDRGRFLLAVRDIQPLEVIMTDTPLVIGPVHSTLPVCLECGKLLGGHGDSLFQCRGCGSPLCSRDCEGGQRHGPECQIFRQAAFSIKVQRYDVPAPEYQFLVTLRLLLLGEDQRRMLELLEDHATKLTENEKSVYSNNVVKIIRENLGQTQWSADLILRYVSIVRTNACLSVKEENKGDAKILLPMVATMNHSCRPNTRIYQNRNNSAVVRAQAFIPKGGEIFNTYTRVMEGAMKRRSDLETTWHFICTCIRCSDVSDGGSHFEALLCQECGGIVEAQTPDTDWACCLCSKTISRENVAQLCHTVLSRIEYLQIEENIISSLECLLTGVAKLLHTNHHAMVMAKIALLREYGKLMTRQADTGNSWKLKQVKRKVELCEESIHVIGLIDPGISELKVSLLYELGPVLYVLIQHELNKGKSKSDVRKRAEDLLLNCRDCVRHFQLGEQAGDDIKAKKCENLMEDLSKFLQSLAA